MAAPPDFGTVEHISLGLTLGVIELGVLLAAVLYGAALVQTYVYASNYPHDPSWVKVVVGFVCLVETLHTACQWAYLYHLSIHMFGNAQGLNELPWYFDSSITLQALSGAAVQAFFSYRVHTLSGKWWLALPGYIGQVMRIGLDIAILVLSLKSGVLSDFQHHWGYIVETALTLSAITDLWNTVLLCIYLRNLKSAYTSTRNVVNSIILFTIETGIITSTCAILIVVTWATMPSNGIWVGINMIYPKLYSNSLLVSLNSRGAHNRHVTTENIIMDTHYDDTSRSCTGNEPTENLSECADYSGAVSIGEGDGCEAGTQTEPQCKFPIMSCGVVEHHVQCET